MKALLKVVAAIFVMPIFALIKTIHVLIELACGILVGAVGWGAIICIPHWILASYKYVSEQSIKWSIATALIMGTITGIILFINQLFDGSPVSEASLRDGDRMSGTLTGAGTGEGK